MNDAFESFLELYAKGDIPSLVRFFLPKPDSSYDDLASSNPHFPYFINYLDACLYGKHSDIRACGIPLKQLIGGNPATYSMALITRLEDELDFVQGKPSSHLLKNPEWADPYHAHQQNIEAFKKIYPHLPSIDIPLYRLNRELLIDPQLSFDEAPSLWIFNDLNHLMQALQYNDVLQALSNSKNDLYILDLYPQKPLQALPKKFVSPNALLKTSIPLISQALDELSKLPHETLNQDSEPADWLYHLSKNALFAMQQHRLGKFRTPALIEKTNIDRWFDPHKGLPDAKRPPLPSYPDYFADTLRNFTEKRAPTKKHIRLTHVTSQIVDEKHAPSRLLESLVNHRNRELFSVSVIVTERIANHLSEYPNPEKHAADSTQWGKLRIQAMEKKGVPVRVLSPLQSYESTSRQVANLLEKDDIDIAVFHGPDVIHCMATNLASCPLRVMFEHGTPLKYPGFDLMIASSSDALRLYGEAFAKFPTKIEALPFNLDVTTTWPKEPPKPEELGIPHDALIMTTVSNHLANRLGNQMLTAIAEILQRVPQAFYAPMGPVTDDKKAAFLQFFHEQGVAKRVLFLGGQSNPGHIARCMKLYLNEFPFGSCIGMLETMASGCVPISMYDPKGPSQARYGGDFMGHDHVITSNRVEDYVDLACKLLTNPELYAEWSAYTQHQYQQFADEKTYVNNFETILINHFNNKV